MTSDWRRKFILNFTSLVWPNCYRFTSHSSLVNWNTLFTEFIGNNRTCLCMCNLPNYNGCGAAMFVQYFASSKFSLILVLVILGRPDNCRYYHLAVLIRLTCFISSSWHVIVTRAVSYTIWLLEVDPSGWTCFLHGGHMYWWQSHDEDWSAMQSESHYW
jgi:hypothetical protein